MVIEPNAETVEAVLDTAWRAANAEASHTDSLDRKAASVATFAALASTIAAARVDRGESHVAVVLFIVGLSVLVAAVAAAVWALLPKERRFLGLAYLESLTRWPQLMRNATEVRGDLAVTLCGTVIVERAANRRKTLAVRTAFMLLCLGLALIAAEVSIVTMST